MIQPANGHRPRETDWGVGGREVPSRGHEATTGVRGRPSKFTKRRTRQIVKAVATGVTLKVAARSAGVSYKTFREWIIRGSQQRRGEFRDFRDAIKKAEAQGELRAVARIGKASTRCWQAAAWFLERKYPDRWGRRARVEETSTAADSESERRYLASLSAIGAPLPKREELIAELRRLLAELDPQGIIGTSAVNGLAELQGIDEEHDG